MDVSRVQTLTLLLIALALPGCDAYGRQPQDDAGKITVTVVQSKPVTITRQYSCLINSYRHIEVRSPADGQLVATPVKLGQTVKRGDVLFQIGSSLDEKNPGPENRDGVVSIKAPFDGLVGRLLRQRGSFVLKGETLTTLFDNSRMWVYFNVPEARYLEYMANMSPETEAPKIELVLANGNVFPHVGTLGAVQAEFNTSTGNIGFRADFPNPERLLRHGQTGTVLVRQVLNDAVVVPQRATFERLDRRYVYVVDRDHVAHQREIVVQHQTEDLFVVKKGVGAGETIVLEGAGLVHDGDRVE